MYLCYYDSILTLVEDFYFSYKGDRTTVEDVLLHHDKQWDSDCYAWVEDDDQIAKLKQTYHI